MNVNIYHKHKDIIITIFIIASRAYLQHALACVHEDFQLAIRSGSRCKISEKFATKSTALMLIWRCLAISLACVMAIFIKLPGRTMHSFGGGGDWVNRIGAANF